MNRSRKSTPFYAQIGRVAAESAQLEHVLDLLIWDLSGLDPQRGSCITAQMLGPRPRYEAIIALALHRNIKDEIVERVETLKRKTFEIQERRNRIVHDAWYSETATGQTAQFKSSSPKDMRYGILDITQEGIDQTIAMIQKRRDDATKLRNDILHELSPGPARS